MKLISKIEVAYFRSIYKQKVDDLSNTNIFFGRNDSGKSNILRALNLFFNYETNPGQGFRFERDFCHARQAEADPTRDIRKFVYVKIWFKTPTSWKASLGEEFWVKRQWSSRDEDPGFDTSIKETVKRQYLTRFLNKIRFYYVPAIKDRRIFEHLLSEIYSVLSRQSEFSETLSEFSGALRLRTDDLTANLFNRLGIKSFISPPTDLTDLFRSLDFETSSDHGDSYSLTLQRGDGVLVRHIPEILAFLSDRGSHEFNLWGFEEPENSLELANAIDEATAFCGFGRSANKQIFLTSHSPAFFSITKPGVKKYFVSKTEESPGGRPTSKLIPLRLGSESPSELMGETPHLPVISYYLGIAHKKLSALKEQSARLAEQVNEHNIPIVFVEGESDRLIFTEAWRKFSGDDMPFRFSDSFGTSKMEGLAKDGSVFQRVAPNRLVFALVDNDKAGRELYANSRLDPGGIWQQHNSNKVWWCRLPFLQEFVKTMKACSVDRKYWPGCLENTFSAELRSEARAMGVYGVTSAPFSELINPECFSKINGLATNVRSVESLYILAPEPDMKISFAEWVVATSQSRPEILEPLRPVIEGLSAILKARES